MHCYLWLEAIDDIENWQQSKRVKMSHGRLVGHVIGFFESWLPCLEARQRSRIKKLFTPLFWEAMNKLVASLESVEGAEPIDIGIIFLEWILTASWCFLCTSNRRDSICCKSFTNTSNADIASVCGTSIMPLSYQTKLFSRTYSGTPFIALRLLDNHWSEVVV